MEGNVLANVKLLYILLLILNCSFQLGSHVEAFSQPQNEPSGPNVCTVEEEKEKVVLEKINKVVQYVTYKWCPDFSKGFQCPETRSATRVQYKSVPKMVKTPVSRCCPGYYQTAENTCNLTSVCDPPCEQGVCIEPNKCQCFDGYAGETCSAHAEQQRFSSSTTIGVSTIVLIILAAVLFVIMMRYRRKYQKERDPMQAMKWQKNEDYVEPSKNNGLIDSNNVFNNRIFDIAADDRNMYEEAHTKTKNMHPINLKAQNERNLYEEALTKGTSMQPISSKAQNEYASLDELNSERSSSSSSQPSIMGKMHNPA